MVKTRTLLGFCRSCREVCEYMQLSRAVCIVVFMLLQLKEANCQIPSPTDGMPKEVQVRSDSHLSHFEQLASGTWTVTALSGTKMYHTWKWGPGKHSIERWTTGESAKGDPWEELVVYYWHPQSKKICILGISPFSSGVNVGEISFDGSTAIADSVLTQTSGKREMQTRWKFITTDKYVETLLEKDKTGKLNELVSFEHRREKTNSAEPSRVDTAAPIIPIEFAPLKFLLGGEWTGRSPANATIHSSFEWMAVSNFIHGTIHVESPAAKTDESASVFVYRKSDSKSLFCLTLSSNSEIYEGEATTVEHGKLQSEWTRYSPASIDSLGLLTEKLSERQMRQTIVSKGRDENKKLTTVLLDR